MLAGTTIERTPPTRLFSPCKLSVISWSKSVADFSSMNKPVMRERGFQGWLGKLSRRFKRLNPERERTTSRVGINIILPSRTRRPRSPSTTWKRTCSKIDQNLASSHDSLLVPTILTERTPEAPSTQLAEATTSSATALSRVSLTRGIPGQAFLYP